ncbi:biotin/lipoyl-containing protein, partial [Vibrio breoganii]
AAAPAASELKEVHVPDIGGDEVEVTEIMVSVGDTVEEEQSLLTVEGDKASMEVPAPFSGTVKEIKVAEGDSVTTGSLIMVFELSGAP